MDEEKEPTQETQETQKTQNGASAPENLEAIKAQLEEEQKAKAEFESTIASKDTRIAELQAEGEALRAERSNLQAELSEAKAEVLSRAKELEAETAKLQAATAELAGIKEAKDQAVAKYLDMAKALNPNIPEGILAGETIQEIDASVEKGKAIVEAVKTAMEAEAAQTKVPAGAPTRGAISLEGLSPREKIAAGIMSLRGTQ
jgi:chromosome segregation ATPase